MTRRSFYFIVAAITLFFLFPFFVNSSAYAAVVINELYPKTSDVTWEWVELYNTSSESVSLNQWKLHHTAGDAKSFILNASAIIGPHGFLTFSGSQTAINFSIEGDTVRLFDEKNNQVDSQSYPGILGYNTSMGRSSDGNGTWTICTIPTYNMPNNCPQPSPTPTPIPTSTPTATPYPTPTATSTSPAKQDLASPDTPTPARQTFGSFLPSPTGTQILGATDTISPTPAPVTDVLQFAVSKTRIAYILLGIAAAALFIMLVLWFRSHQFRRKL